jgi:hypothetical protein
MKTMEQHYKGVITRAIFRLARLLAFGPDTITGSRLEHFRAEVQEILHLLEKESGLCAGKTSTEKFRSGAVDMPWG